MVEGLDVLAVIKALSPPVPNVIHVHLVEKVMNE
jgi:hypothetical protein